MFFATTPVGIRHAIHSSAGRSLERFLSEAQSTCKQAAGVVKQDEKSYTLSIDIPGVTKDQLNIGIEGSIVRIATKEGAPRQYNTAYELPQDIDIVGSEAKLENGVLTLTLGKQVAANRVTALTIN